MKRIQVRSNEEPHLSQMGDNSKIYVITIHCQLLKSSPEPIGQFQQYCAQRIFRRRELCFGHMKSRNLFLGKDNCERIKIHCQLLKCSPKPVGQFQLCTIHPLVKGIQVNLKIRLSQ